MPHIVIHFCYSHTWIPHHWTKATYIHKKPRINTSPANCELEKQPIDTHNHPSMPHGQSKRINETQWALYVIIYYAYSCSTQLVESNDAAVRTISISKTQKNWMKRRTNYQLGRAQDTKKWMNGRAQQNIKIITTSPPGVNQKMVEPRSVLVPLPQKLRPPPPRSSRMRSGGFTHTRSATSKISQQHRVAKVILYVSVRIPEDLGP